MTMLFHDVYQDTNKGKQMKFQDIDFSDLLYADDTMLVSSRANPVNKMLHAIEKHSKRYNLNINKEKCNYISMNTKDTVKFSDETNMKKAEEAEYLGAIMTKKHTARTELENRIAKTMIVAKK